MIHSNCYIRPSAQYFSRSTRSLLLTILTDSDGKPVISVSPNLKLISTGSPEVNSGLHSRDLS